MAAQRSGLLQQVVLQELQMRQTYWISRSECPNSHLLTRRACSSWILRPVLKQLLPLYLLYLLYLFIFLHQGWESKVPIRDVRAAATSSLLLLQHQTVAVLSALLAGSENRTEPRGKQRVGAGGVLRQPRVKLEESRRQRLESIRPSRSPRRGDNKSHLWLLHLMLAENVRVTIKQRARCDFVLRSPLWEYLWEVSGGRLEGGELHFLHPLGFLHQTQPWRH